ncbi:MAG: Gfo/Idh/MocA family oxidoreductase [Spirochaetales bacterium]|nr:Gfo/Idh/MocA family oxidoreductase [Spirochaetales bacterium]
MVTKKIRLGVVGGGKQAEEHLSALKNHSLACLAGIQEIDPQRQKYLRDTYGHDSVLNTNETWQDRHVDGLILCLPHDAYEAEWENLLQVKVPLLKEKPLGRTPEEALMFLDLCHKANIPLQTAIQRRSHPSYQHLKRELQGQTLTGLRAGLHLGFKNNLPTKQVWRSDPCKSGGGALLDSGYHLVDLVMFLAGPFRLLSSHIVSQGKLWQAREIDDEAHLFGINKTTWISIESKTYTTTKKEWVEIQTATHHYLADRESVKKDGITVYTCERDWDQAMSTQLTNFSENIRSGKFQAPEIRDQFPAMRLIMQAYHQNTGLTL